jgi:hypothetical protein
MQYRSKLGRVFELTDGAAILTVHIVPRQSPLEPDDWHVETRLDTGTGPPVVDGWGASPAEALGAVARTWVGTTPSLQVFNWETVTHELRAVQAV